ncbi:hypothetical protein L3Q67_18045 [Saccharothrix sp. AJ9571]|nr:hypothetical protein L3Q67_18045 [Saccharothrix sp. AJ9571]
MRTRFTVAAAGVSGFRSTLDDRGFTEIHTPKIVGSATESGANVFELGYFGRRAYLAQSPQLFKQAMVGVFERVYEVGPVFRAEPHDTARHLAQYTSLDAESGFIGDHRDVMALLREVLAGMTSTSLPTTNARCRTGRSARMTPNSCSSPGTRHASGRSTRTRNRADRSYLDTFAHGMPPHGGFAIGLERWVARVLGLDNVRYTTLFPRDLHRLSP